MNQYSIKISKRAEKFITKQPSARQKQLIEAIRKLPYEGDIKSMAGETNCVYRLRVGDYRVIYERREDIFTILVINAGNRGDIYKK